MKPEVNEPTGLVVGAYSIPEFCSWARVGRTAVYAEMKAGRLTARKFGRRTLIPKSEAERWMAALPLQRAA